MEGRLKSLGRLGRSLLPHVLVDRHGERGGGVTQNGRDDHRMHPSTAKLRGHGVAHVVNARGGMHLCLSDQPLEGASEGIRVRREAVPAIADHGDGLASLVERVMPSTPQSGAALELLPLVLPDALESEEAAEPAGETVLS
jgi:hypothetical protein